jgi:hypothetical protein
MPFNYFVDAMDPILDRLSLAVAIDCIMLHSGKGVLLLVDEVMKHDQPEKIVSAVTVCLDTLSVHFNAVITTLNEIAFHLETLSGRIIIWIELPPATLADAVSLFDGDHSFALLQCIADCNGHFRSLEVLKVMIEGRTYWSDSS